MKMTKARVFIIESLSFDDERKNRFEGSILSQILHLGGKKSEYYYLRTKKELVEVLGIFQESDYRYLHLSCHGTRASFDTTLDQITFSQFSKLVKPYLSDKRLFISSCDAVNDNLANEVIPTSGCRSIVGPNTSIEFSDAAIIWASFYHLVFKAERSKITRNTMEPALRKVVDMFGVSLNYFSKSKSEGYTHQLVEPLMRSVKKRTSHR